MRIDEPVDACCEHPVQDHDPEMGCLHGWTATVKGCPCQFARQLPKAPASLLDQIAVAMAVSGATGFRRSAGGHDGRWRRNR